VKRDLVRRGDLVKTQKGNIAIVIDTRMDFSILFLDVMWLKSGRVRTGFPSYKCEVISEAR
jgi:hypothetical protein